MIDYNKKRKLLLAALIIMALSIVAIIIVVIIGKDRFNNVITAEQQEQVESLNETLASIVDKDPNHNYTTPNEVSPNYGAVPEEIILLYNINVENPDFSSATSVAAMNSNILNFYLDQEDTIVAILEPSGISSLDKKSTTLFIYASAAYNYSFVGFDPSDFNPDGSNKDDYLFPEEAAIHFSRSELFNQLTSSTKFYIVKKPASDSTN
ncbi:hypothetical protein IK146_01655 [Candidatus Saccharibacteria bacterium]|nr:hypothetical protein [Candidatus Saccharibacteria bacterium]